MLALLQPPPSPVVVEVPAARAATERFLAGAESAPKPAPAIVIGIFVERGRELVLDDDVRVAARRASSG